MQAAARMPAWRIPPPKTFRQRRASSTKSAGPATMDPTGAPSPFEKHRVAESQWRV